MKRIEAQQEEMVVAGFNADNLPPRQSMLDLLNARVRENEEANVLENEFKKPEGPENKNQAGGLNKKFSK